MKRTVLIMAGGNAGPDLSFTVPVHLDRVAADPPCGDGGALVLTRESRRRPEALGRNGFFQLRCVGHQRAGVVEVVLDEAPVRAGEHPLELIGVDQATATGPGDVGGPDDIGERAAG